MAFQETPDGKLEIAIGGYAALLATAKVVPTRTLLVLTSTKTPPKVCLVGHCRTWLRFITSPGLCRCPSSPVVTRSIPLRIIQALQKRSRTSMYREVQTELSGASLVRSMETLQ